MDENNKPLEGEQTVDKTEKVQIENSALDETETVEIQTEPADEVQKEESVQAAKKDGIFGLSKKTETVIALMALLIVILIIVIVILLVSRANSDEDESEATASVSVSQTGEDTSEDEAESDEEKSEADSSEADEAEDEDGYIFYYSGDNTWENGDLTMTGMEMAFKNGGDAIDSWTLELEIEGLESCEGWNGTYEIDGDTLTVTPADYNASVTAGGTVDSLGCNIGTNGDLNVKSAKLNGEECEIKKGSVPSSSSSTSQDGSEDVDVTALLERTDEAEQGDDWLYADGNKLYDKDGKEVWLTGVNWFGYNTGTNTFDGLWTSVLTTSVKSIADHGFNLIRVPFSAELVNQWADGEYPQANYNNAYNPELNSMNSLEIFDYFLKLAEENGLKVMIDIHSAETDASGHNVNLWYTDSVSVEDYYSALEWMAQRYSDNDTIIAYDLKNEPHGKPAEGDAAAKWDDSTDDNNWKYVAETAAKKVLAKNPNVLIMVEGIEATPKVNGNYTTDSDDYYFNWWGGNLRAVEDYPIDLGDYQDKLVYSPHDYGPTVYEQSWFEGDYDYDSLMEDCWYDNWFYIYEEETALLLIGEWGGFMTEPNITWMTYLRQLIKTYHINHTFWCFNSNSGDTGGLVLDDFTTWDEEKYEFVKEVLWQEDGKFVGLDHEIPLGENGITLTEAEGL
ncbi:MAG: cellulase family glycosylhydrolase [Ruminococcus sp.]|nr:cellulase family glycosylhydrolase [Ruminococcus sp.]